jgi:hypothetical protein
MAAAHVPAQLIGTPATLEETPVTVVIVKRY